MSAEPYQPQAGWLARMRGSLQLGRRGLWAGFVLALVLMTVTTAVSYRSIDSFMSASDTVDRTQGAIHDLKDVLSRLQDAETGQRGYLVTGNESFLEPYHGGVREIPSSLASVRIRLDDPPESLAYIEELIDKRLELLRQGITQKRARAAPDELHATLTQGKEVMDSIRARIAGVVDARESQLSEQSLELAGDAVHVKRTIVMGNLFASVLLMLAFVLLKAQVEERSSAQRRAQLQAAEAADLFDNAPCAYHSVASGGRLVRVNETWLRWFGYARDEVIGKLRHQDLMTPDSARRLVAQQMDPHSAFKRNGSVSDLEFEYTRKDGSTFSAVVSATRIAASAASEATSRTALFDVTERNRVHNEMRKLHSELQHRTLQLEATNKELESFTYSVSHDLRSPLRAIDGFSRMIEEDQQDRLDADGRRMLGVVRQNAAQMGCLIDDLLVFARLGRQSLSKAPVDMKQLAGEALAELQAGQGGVAADTPATAGPHIGAQIRIGEMPEACGDRMLLRQVWINLLGNAIKYSGKEASPEVRVGGRVVSMPQGEECEYCVEDNGVGFDMRYYDKLFGVFQRLHSPAEYPGTGVGLAIVQRIVIRHGGRVWADAKVNAGAKFYFSLPTGREHA